MAASPSSARSKADEFRSVFEAAVSDIRARTGSANGDGGTCLILSGGVDTCAILEASEKLGIEYGAGLTVITGDDSPDRTFSEAAAGLHALEHVVVRLSPEALVDTYLPVCVRILGTYDGMTLRNSLVVAAVFERAAAMGYRHAVVGDGADELFGGYSFMWGSADDPDGWKEKRDSMCLKWTFATAALAVHYGLESHAPFTDPEVVRWALAETGREDCIGERPIRLVHGGDAEDRVTGKIVLREAYATVSSWRRKDPIEVGSGATVIGHDAYWKDIVSDEEFAEARGELLGQGFDVKTKEYLVNFRVFQRFFGRHGETLPGATRLGMGEGCVGCCFDVGEEMFCRICGAYPAQRAKASAGDR